MTGHRGPNWMLYGLIGVSLLLHVWLFYQAREMMHKPRPTTIEVEVSKGSPPPARVLPKPPQAVSDQVVADPDLHTEKPQHRETVVPPVPVMPEQVPEAPAEQDLPAPIPEPAVAEWKGPSIPNRDEGGSRADYFNRVRLSIEKHKQYPFSARQRHLEGKVILSFAIDSGGSISAISVVEASRFSVLNEAAVAAVQDAAPFEKPPAELFDPPIELEVPILFELQR